MPLTTKGKKLKSKFREQYGKKKGDSVFYAMENSGKLKKVVKARVGAAADQYGGSKSSSGGNGKNFVEGFKIQLDYLGSQVFKKSLIQTKAKNIDENELISVLSEFCENILNDK